VNDPNPTLIHQFQKQQFKAGNGMLDRQDFLGNKHHYKGGEIQRKLFDDLPMQTICRVLLSLRIQRSEEYLLAGVKATILCHKNRNLDLSLFNKKNWSRIYLARRTLYKITIIQILKLKHKLFQVKIHFSQDLLFILINHL